MAEETNFTATGPATAGFKTHGTRIERGADLVGTEAGARGRGITGLVGEGEAAGVTGVGPEGGVWGEGLSGGPGGVFLASRFSPQLNLVPQMTTLSDGEKPAAAPREVQAELPLFGKLGDLWLASISDSELPLAMWICVFASGANGEPAAEWAQVLLGKSRPGKERPDLG